MINNFHNFMPKETKEGNIFDTFTGKYQLSKTLRFELKPAEYTKKFLKEHKVFEKDEVIHESYLKAKPYFDQIHREFIEEALAPDNARSLSFISFERVWNVYQKDKKDGRREFETAKKEAYRMVTKLLDDYADSWKSIYAPDAKQSGTELLCSSEILPVLKARFPQEVGEEALFVKDQEGKQRYIFDSFDGFTTYLGKFQETRRNLYKDDGTSTAVATRVIENLVSFLENKSRFEKYLTDAKELHLKDEEVEACKLSNYPNCMIQSGIKVYNGIVGELNTRMKKLRDQAGKDAKKNEYPLLKKFYSQILAKKEIEADEVSIEKIDDVIPAFRNFCREVDRLSDGAQKLMHDIASGTMYSNEHAGIYVHNRAINTIARRWFISAYEFESALPSQGTTKDGNVRVDAFVSLADVENALAEKITEDTLKERIIEEFRLEKKAPAFSQFLMLFAKEMGKLDAGYRAKNKTFSKLNLKIFDRGKKDDHVDKLKDALECGLNIVQFVKYFALSSKKAEDKPASISSEFYNRYDDLYGEPDAKHIIVRYHDAFRNFLTLKLEDADKIKINFESGTPIKWTTRGYIFRDRDTQIYNVGILVKGGGTQSDFEPNKKTKGVYGIESSPFEQMFYQQLKFQTLAGRAYIRDYKLKYSQDPNAVLHLQELIKKQFIKTYPSLQPLISSKYTSKKEFDLAVKECLKGCYALAFMPVVRDYVIKKESEGAIYLFEISYRDKRSKIGALKNIHTLYFEELFSQKNCEHVTLKLNSEGTEIFSRKAQIQEEHEKRRNVEVIKKKRYTTDKIFLHLPIKLNPNAEQVNAGFRYRYNQEINSMALGHGEGNIIGIDRGEKHLAFYSVINRDSKIIASGSFNEINGVNYFEMLRMREKERLEQRRSWKAVSQIKDLKGGYISQVIHQLAELVIEHNAIIVFEDLNLRFKEIRGGVERSVYQQLEKAVIEKFSYMVFKKREALAPGGVLNGYQFATPVQSFEEMSRQNGIIFYVNPEYTSITDPITGWRQHIYLSSSANDSTLLEAFTKKIQIGWDELKQSYTFSYNQKDFARDKDAVSHEWVLYADMPRIDRYRNKDGYWEAHKINPNELLKELFSAWEFHQLEGDMSEQIAIMYADKALQGEREVNGKKQRFFKALRYYLNIIQQIRNSDSVRYVPDRDKEGNIKEDKDNKWVVKKIGDDIDFIASPVEPFFAIPSQYSKENLCGLKIENGDANGAYNIARKGIIALQRVRENPEKPELYITRSDWDRFVQK